MIRALASLIAVCLVAATGVRSVVIGEEPASTLSVPHKVEKLHTRVGQAAVVRRAAVSGAELLAIVVGDGWRVATPAVREARLAAGGTAPAVRAISLPRARGPPVV